MSKIVSKYTYTYIYIWYIINIFLLALLVFEWNGLIEAKLYCFIFFINMFYFLSNKRHSRYFCVLWKNKLNIFLRMRSHTSTALSTAQSDAWGPYPLNWFAPFRSFRHLNTASTLSEFPNCPFPILTLSTCHNFIGHHTHF